MKIILVLAVLIVFAITAGAVLAADRGAMYDSQTAVAQAQTEGIVAQAESQAEIAGYQSSADIAAITAQLEIARLEMEMTKLANQVELEKVQAMMTQTNALLTQNAIDLERAKLERERMWMMLIIPALAVIALVIVAMVVLVIVLRRPAAPSYPMITTNGIVTTRPTVAAVVLSTRVQKRQDADYYEVRR